MPNPKKPILASLAIIGAITIVVVLVSIFAVPSSYDTPIKIAILAVTALTGTIATASGISSAADFFKPLFTPKTQLESVKSPSKINNVPLPNFFVGRSQELNALKAYLTDKKVKTIVITGIGGIGKSTLAQQAVYSCLKNYPGGAAWLSIRDYPDFSMHNAIKELGKIFNLGGNDEVHQLLIRYFQTKPSIVVLDNLESLSPQDLLQVKGFANQVSTAWGTKFIITLRPPLSFLDGKSDERHIHISNGLDFENAKKYLEVLVSDENSIKGEILKEADWIINRIEGHPKMLETVAILAKHRGWQRIRPLISSLSGELKDKIHDLYSGSVELLGQEGKKILVYLPLLFLIPSFSYDDVAIACGDIEKSWSLQGLDQVSDSGLISYNAIIKEFTIHQTVIDYINSKFPLSRGEELTVFGRLLIYYQNLKNPVKFPQVLMAYQETTEEHDITQQ